MRQSEQINEIAKALVAVQAELEPVAKDSVNPHFKNKYASLDTITEAVRPVLARHGVAIVQGGGETTAAGILVTTMLVHTSGQWISSSFLMPLEKQSAQSAGSAVTYGRRYLLGAMLALATEDDDDGQAASRPTKAPAKAKPATDEQLQRIIELAEFTGDTFKISGKLSTLTTVTADEWIQGLTAKYNRMAASGK